MKEMQQTPKDGKAVKEKKRTLEPKSIYCLYWSILILVMILGLWTAFLFLINKPNATESYLFDVFLGLWILTLSAIFFDTAGILYVQITHDYRLLAKKVKEHKYWPEFRALFAFTGILTVVNFIWYTINVSLVFAIVPILAGLVISGIIRFVRLRYYQS